MIFRKLVSTLVFILLSQTAICQKTDSTRFDKTLKEARQLLNKQQFEEGYAKLDSVIDVANLDNQLDYYLSAIFAKTTSLAKTRQLQEANRLLEEVEKVIEERLTKPDIYFGWVSLLKGELLYRSGDFENAITTLKKALTEYSPIASNRSFKDQGRANNIIAIIYARTSYFEEAVMHATSSINLYTQAEAAPTTLFVPYNTLGGSYLRQGKFRKAEEVYLEALNVLKRSERDLLANKAVLYTNLSILNSNLRRFNLALEYQEEAFRIAEKRDNYDINRVVRRHSDLARAYAEARKDSLALLYLEKAQLLLDKAPESSGSLQAEIFSQKARLYEQAGSSQKSIDYYEQALKSYAEVFGTEDQNQVGVKTAIAANQFDLGQYDKSEESLLKSLSILKKISSEKNQFAVEAYSLLADVYLKQKRYQKALDAIEEAILSTEGYSISDETNFVNVLDRESLLRSLLTKAKINHALNLDTDNKIYADKALKNYQYCDLLLNELQESTIYEDQLSLIQNLDEVYASAVTLTFQLYTTDGNKEHLDLAYYYAGRKQNMLLRQQLNQSYQKKFGSIPTAMLNMERDLKEDISFIHSELYEIDKDGIIAAQDSSFYNEYNNRLFTKKRSLDSLKKVFKEQHPTYFSTQYKEDEISLQKLQKGLKADAQIIQFINTAESLFIISIQDEALGFFKVPNDTTFKKQLESYLKLLQNPLSDTDDLVELGTGLYSYLLGPLGQLKESLTIIADGPLSMLPFETLSLPDLDGRSRFLIENHSVGYNYAISSFSQAVKTKPRKKIRLMAMASSYNNRRQSATSDNIRAKLGPLQWTIEEVNNLTALYGGVSYLESEASETNFKANAKNKDVIHIASHGLVDYERPLFSRLVLEKDLTDTINDGNLFVHELYNMSLNANMVVLSACNTASGNIARGEGLLNLGRGFFYAGVPNVVMSHWQVDDQATSILMKYFYAALASGKTKSEALRDAKTLYISEASPNKKHPYYWGAFISMGDDSPIVQKGVAPIMIIIPITLIFIMVGVFVRKRRQTTI